MKLGLKKCMQGTGIQGEWDWMRTHEGIFRG